MKITGNEPYHPIVAKNGKPSGISTGVTIYQQMVIEFTKAASSTVNKEMTLKMARVIVAEARRLAKEVIKQLNEENPTEPVKRSILDGKVAIRVDNEREFKLLMEHYESKGWKWATGADPLLKDINFKFPNLIKYHDRIQHSAGGDAYIGVSFSDFAAEVGITVPKFIMKSEDGVDLYEGDDHSVVTLCLSGEWSYAGDQKLAKSQMVVSESNRAKAFSTREAAEKWIEEQNRPKEIKLTDGQTYAIVHENGFIAHVNQYNSYQLEEIYNAYKSLKSDETVNDN